MIAWLSALALAGDYSMPTSEDWRSRYVVSAYKDAGGLDWNCGSVYYSGHKGTDFAIYGSWSTMALGVAIVAAREGTVYSTHDGEPDDCTTGDCGTSNYVYIRHDDGTIAMYLHMKTWSVAVATGERVECGQKLGEVGSSGYSTGPHLHFELRTGSTSIEPFQGSCGASSSSWIEQGSYRGLPTIVCEAVDADGDGFDSGEDCDDADPSVNPAASERCNGRDDDCDGQTDEDDAVDAPTWYRDADGDGFGDPGQARRACSQPDGHVADSTDCNDGNSRSHPGAVELCDGDDNDCDGEWDEGFDRDLDGDRTCDGDCNDDNPEIHPGAEEVENGLDDDCDGWVDDGTAAFDDDWDGWTEDEGDCADDDPFVFPGAPERENGLDDDCDGRVDEEPAVEPWAADPEDRDGDGWSEAQGDCDDLDRLCFPGAPELLDEEDNDCDGLVDNRTVRFDDDGDGFSEQAGDCRDGDPAVHPGAIEEHNGLDDDCNGVVDDRTAAFDDDGDGWTEEQGDCDDRNAAAWPGAPEQRDAADNDCDGVVDEGTAAFDDDGDGWTEEQGDCDDGRPTVFPGAPEALDGVDEDCDGVVDDQTRAFDDDHDGWTEEEGDCDDGNPWIHPGATEHPDGLDGDCDGLAETPRGWGAGGCQGAPISSGPGLLPALLLLRRRRR